MFRVCIAIVAAGATFAACLPNPRDPVQSEGDRRVAAASQSSSPIADERTTPDDEPEAAPPEKRRKPRVRPEEDLPTHDLLMRGGEAGLPEEQIVDALELRFDVDYQDRTLRDCLTTLAQTADVNLWIDERTDDILPKSSGDERETSVWDRPHTLRERQQQFVTLLELLLEPHKLGWCIRHDALCIEPRRVLEHRLETRTFDVAPQIAAGHDPAGLVDAVAAMVVSIGEPEAHQRRSSVPDEAPAVALSGQVLFVRHNQRGLMEVAQILEELESIADDEEKAGKKRAAPLAARTPSKRRAASRPSESVASRTQPRTTPALFSASPGQEPPRIQRAALPGEGQEAPESISERILEALDERFDVDFDGKSVRTILEQLAAQANVPLRFDVAAMELKDLRESLDRNISLRLRQARLESLLNLALRGTGCHWMIRHESLWITGYSVVRWSFESRTYDVANLIGSGHDPLELVDAIRTTVEPRTWGLGSRASSPTEAGAVDCNGEVLFVRQSQLGHLAVAQVIGELDAIVEDSEADDQTRADTLTWRTYRVTPEAAESLGKMLPEIVAPESWRGGAKNSLKKGKGELRSGPGFLLIRQTRSVHHEISKVLTSP